MDRHEVSLVAREFREIRKTLDDLDRRQAATLMSGKVAAIDGNRIRLEILPTDGRTGKPFLSPWVQLQEAAGATSSHFPVAIGDPMRLLSPNGELGPQSLAVRDGYTAEKANPTDEKQQKLVLAFGGAELRMGGGKIELVAEVVDNVSRVLSHNSVDVGESHLHTGVVKGPELTGPPQG